MDDLSRMMDFEKLWRDTPDTDRLKLIAGYAYSNSQQMAEFKTQLIDHEKRLTEIERIPTNNAKWAGAKAGGTVTGIASFFAMLLFFLGKFFRWWD